MVLLALLWPSQQGSGIKANSETLADISREADGAIGADHVRTAITIIEKGLRIDPNWKDGLWKAGLVLYQHDQFERARNYLHRLTRADPTSGRAWALEGMCELQLHKFQAAIEDIGQADRLGIPSQLSFSGAARRDRAIAYIELGDFGSAVNLLNKLVPCENPEEREQLITIFGYASLQQSTEHPLTPEQTAIVHELGEARYASASGDHSHAKALLESLIQKYPDQPMLHYTYGSLLFSWSDYDAAKKQFHEELAISPSSLAARLALAYLGLETNETEEALPYALEASKMRPDFYLSHLYLGRLLIAENQITKGCRELEIARTLSPSSSQVRYALATTYRRLGRIQDAHRELREFERLRQLENGANGGISAQPSSAGAVPGSVPPKN
jgi:predicted Zn-dependent protease